MAKRIVGGRYELINRLQGGDISRGIPELWKASDLGELYYVKLWRRRPGDAEILALWNREVRSLMRLQGYPGAGELFVQLRDLGQSDSIFFVVLEGGRRVLLSEALKDRPRFPILTNLTEVNRRRALWEGLLRIAEGLSVLHGDGTLHRSLSTSSIFVSQDGTGDFRLSGFEWSLRVAGTDGGATSVARTTHIRAPELDKPDGEFSTSTDWYDFGLVCAEVFGVAVATRKRRLGLAELIQQITALRDAEKKLLVRLLSENAELRFFSGEEVLSEIRNIVRDLNVTTSGLGRDLILAFRLDPDAEFCRTISRVSGGQISPGDQAAQLKWIKNDLRGDIRVTSRQSQKAFILRGERLEYRVRQWSMDGLSTWDIGFCEAAERSPRMLDDDQYYSIGERKLDVLTYTQVRKNLKRVRDRSFQWDRSFPFRTGRQKLPSDLAEVHDFFRITQQLDIVHIAAKICPVEILTVSREVGTTRIVVTPLEESERNDLARHLKLPSPSELLKEWASLGAVGFIVDDDEDPGQARFSFLERRTVTSEGSTDQWRFAGAVPHPHGPRYAFEAQGSPLVKEGRSYLASSHGGTLAQVRRRHLAIEQLRSYQGLLKQLSAPKESTRDSGEHLPKGSSSTSLDTSKIDALERLWRLRPSFSIQGPPGTGKTTLITAFADRLFSADESSQVLITAHSHHTVDDVRLKLMKMFGEGTSSPICVRLGSKRPTEHDVDKITAALLAKLAASDLVSVAPDFLKYRIQATAGLIEGESEDTGQEIGTMQMLVQDSANLTFATLNSGELFDLSERGRRFDWSIIEEAGKAHGFDMAVALQESHRLLMIGDHFQLPPFNSRLYEDLLGDPLRVRKSILAGVQFAPGLVDPSLVEDLGEDNDFGERCTRWARMVTLFGDVFNRSVGDLNEVAPAATLTDQHRMHPEIAELVGRVFYPSEDGSLLKSPPETVERFATAPPFQIKDTSTLPDNRVVWWNVPWVQRTKYAAGETDGLFVSQPEAHAVVQILEQLEARGDSPCELQILSPYTDQIAAIRAEIDSAYGNGMLRHLFEPPFSIKDGKRMGATVDEFQGSEADIVIVSLVRNNALPPWKSLGFLKDRTRMNVLLSRARQKLIVVGSWSFFSSRRTETSTPDDDYYYIGEMMDEMGRALSQGKLGLAGFALDNGEL